VGEVWRFLASLSFDVMMGRGDEPEPGSTIWTDSVVMRIAMEV
jgi:hypothetical protein